MSAELRYELEKAAAHEVAVRLEGILGGHVDEATQRFVYEEKQVETKEL
jgi:hypothetical protein